MAGFAPGSASVYCLFDRLIDSVEKCNPTHFNMSVQIRLNFAQNQMLPQLDKSVDTKYEESYSMN